MKKLLPLLFLLLVTGLAQANNGLVSVKSAHDVKTTADRLEAVLKKKGMTVFNRIDHAKGAKSVGNDLRPTELIIFGNPKIGSVLMGCGQTIAIDLPQKALIWQDGGGQVWLSYNEPTELAKRHRLPGCEKVIQKVTGALGKFAGAATKP
jgi:uncharacterized protein (DUF302 family)